MSERERKFTNPERKPRVKELLDRHRIPYAEWGSEKYPAAQRLEDLEREVEAGYAVLLEKEGELIREASVALIDVRYRDAEGKNWELVEKKRSIHGAEDDRHTEIGKRVQAGKSPQQAALQGLREAGVVNIEPDALEYLQQRDEQYKPEEGWKYPGLGDLIHYHEFMIECGLENIKLGKTGNPVGYEHRRPGLDKITEYEWRLVDGEDSSSAF